MPQISRQLIATKTTELINDHAGRKPWETLHEDNVLCFYLGGESLELIAFEKAIEAWLVDEYALPPLTDHVVHGGEKIHPSVAESKSQTHFPGTTTLPWLISHQLFSLNVVQALAPDCIRIQNHAASGWVALHL